MLNTLRYTKSLEEVGVAREQAEVHMQIITEVIESELATKQDMKDLKSELKQEMQELRHEMQSLRVELKNDMQLLRTEVQLGMKSLERDLVFKLSKVMAGMFAIFGLLMKLHF